MNISKMGQVAVVVMVGALLTGCEPSQTDVASAVQKQFDKEAKATRDLVGDLGSRAPKIKSVKKLGCKEDGENAYRCDVEVEVAMNGQTEKKIVPARLVKGSDGWALAR